MYVCLLSQEQSLAVPGLRNSVQRYNYWIYLMGTDLYFTWRNTYAIITAFNVFQLLLSGISFFFLKLCLIYAGHHISKLLYHGRKFVSG